MIIAFDGNVFSGKTTLCNFLAHKYNCNHILEYSDFIKEINGNIYKKFNFYQHHKYLKIERARKKYLKNGLNVLDRSFVSLSAHIYAMYKIGVADFRKHHIRLFSNMLLTNNIIMPDYFVFLSCDHRSALKRFINNKNGMKKTPEIFINRKYYLAIHEFNILWQKNIKNGLIINNASKIKIEKKINKIINKPSDRLTSKKIISITKYILLE